MASVLELVLEGKVSPDIVVAWLRKTINDDLPPCLEGLANVSQELIPFFLNYLRDHTLHLLQTSKSATPSPAKTPSIKKLNKFGGSRQHNDSRKRQQLFGSSPAADVDELKHLPSSVFSPNTSIDSPGHVNRHADKTGQLHVHRGSGRSNYASQRWSPRCGSPAHTEQTPDHQRSKQKFSLGEFFCTPDHGPGGGWKKSPHSGGRREQPSDNSPSPVMSRKSGGKKKHGNSPLVQSVSRKLEQEVSAAPVFSLASTNDFPPMRMGSTGQTHSTNSLVKPDPNSSCDAKISRAINFSSNIQIGVESTKKAGRDFVRTSPVDASAGPSRQQRKRIAPTLVKVDSSQPQNPAFLVPVEESGDNVTSRAQSNLSKAASGNDISQLTKTIQLNSPGSDFSQVTRKGQWTPSPGSDIAPGVRKGKYPSPRNETAQETQSSASLTSIQEGGQAASCDKLPLSPSPVVLPETESCKTPIITPTKLKLEHSTSLETVEARVGEVTHQDKLDLLISLYSKCLEANLMPNLVVELYFLSQLLTARGGEQEQDSQYGDELLERNFFSTVHNAVYFAVSIMEQQRRLLMILDKGTIRLLSESQRILSFSPSLQAFLEEAYTKALSQKLQTFPRSPIGCVSFQADTDNRRNFPNDKSFHLFKRQRDGFYELLREWEAGHLNPDWNMSEFFKNKVRALVGFKTELANHMHFSRLFQSQLLAMCKGDGSIRLDTDDENIALLSQLKRSNPEKFKRLQERFIKPLSVGGPCPTPAFPGCQEFFRDFIVTACNPVFNQHLSDTFSAKILELNDWSFSVRDEDDAVTATEDQEERDTFCTVVMSARLVGKFLGFVTFLPYQSPERLPDSIEALYVAVRNKQQPPLVDLCQCLRVAMTQGDLSLTVPWVVEYLSMMDSVAPRLDYFQLVLFLLLFIHRCLWGQMLRDGEVCYSRVMIVSMVSWLFDNPVLPEGFFFSDVPDTVVNMSAPQRAGGLDNSFVDQSLFYTCCPYIGEIKALLVEFAVGTSSKASTIRKITPVSADVPAQKSLTGRQLQLQMEENFFHNHPASMKRVVDFVADRTASNFIKKFRGNLLHESLLKGKEKVLKQLVAHADTSPSSKLKDRVAMVTMKVAQELHSSVRSSVAGDSGRYCTGRIPALMTSLLPDDQADSVVDVASSVSGRMAEEKIIQWMNKHITISMFQTELLPDMEKVNKTINNWTQQEAVVQPVAKTVSNQSSQPSHVTAASHNDKLPHPSEVLIEVKDAVRNLMLRNMLLSKEKLSALILVIQQSVEQRQDILPAVHKSFSQLTQQLLLALIIKQPELYVDAVVGALVGLLTGELKDRSLDHVFCGKIVWMLQDSPQPNDSWLRYNQLLCRLQEKNILCLPELQENCLNILRITEDVEVVRRVAVCLCELADCVSDEQKTEELGPCLDTLYHLLEEKEPDLAQAILVKLVAPDGRVQLIIDDNENVEKLCGNSGDYMYVAESDGYDDTERSKDTQNTSNTGDTYGTSDTKVTADTPNTADTRGTADTDNTADTRGIHVADTDNRADIRGIADTDDTADTRGTADTDNRADTRSTAATPVSLCKERPHSDVDGATERLLSTVVTDKDRIPMVVPYVVGSPATGAASDVTDSVPEDSRQNQSVVTDSVPEDSRQNQSVVSTDLIVSGVPGDTSDDTVLHMMPDNASDNQQPQASSSVHVSFSMPALCQVNNT